MKIDVMTRRQFYGAVGVIALISFSLSLWINRTTWFISDDFALLTYRYFNSVDGQWSQTLFGPHNDHLIALPILVFIGLGHLVGLNNHMAYMMPAILFHGSIIFAVAVILRKRCESPITALSAACCVAFMSSGYEILMMATNMAHISCVAFALFQLILLEKDNDNNYRIYLASMLGVASVFCSGTSIPLIAMVALYLLLQRDVKRSLIIALPPASVWLIWFIKFGTLNHGSLGPYQYTTFDKFIKVIRFATTGLQESFSAISHFSGSSTFLIAICLLGLNKGKIKKEQILMPISMAVGSIIFYLVTGFSRVNFGNETSSRYLYVAAIFLVPLIFIGIESVFEKILLRQIFTICFTLWVSITGILGFLAATETSQFSDPIRIQNLFLARDLVAGGEAPVSGTPSPAFDPDLTYEWIRKLVENNMWNKK